MIPISFSWDTQKRLILLKWNGLVSFSWENGKVSTKIIGRPIPFRHRQRMAHLSIRWTYLKGAFSFLTKWKLKKIEGALSFSDPMLNGLLYGWLSAFNAGNVDRKIDVSTNFLGENWCRGEFILSPKILFHHLKKWILPFLWETRERKQRRGGG